MNKPTGRKNADHHFAMLRVARVLGRAKAIFKFNLERETSAQARDVYTVAMEKIDHAVVAVAKRFD